MNDRVLSFLGLCRRANKLVIGAEAAAEEVFFLAARAAAIGVAQMRSQEGSDVNALQDIHAMIQ